MTHLMMLCNGLGEMLLTNQQIDKLAAARVTFKPHISVQLRDPQDQHRTLQTMRSHVQACMEAISDCESDGRDGNELPEKMVTSEGDVRLPKHAGVPFINFLCSAKV